MVNWTQIICTKQNKQKVFNKVLDLLNKNNGRLKYEAWHFLYSNEYMQDPQASNFLTIAMMLYADIITLHIPIADKEKGLFKRDYKFADCGAQAFRFANRDETLIRDYSRTAKSQLPPLEFANKDNEFFIAGAGAPMPDLFDTANPQNTYEVKWDYFNSTSPSTLHKAKFLLNCKPDGTLEVWYVENNIPTRLKQTINNIGIQPRAGQYKPKYINFYDWNIIHDGLWLEELDQYLSDNNIKWSF